MQRRKKRKVLIGRNNGNNIVHAVPKLTSTKPEDRVKLPVNNLDSVVCESHPSKYPTHYASMKVTIHQDELKKLVKYGPEVQLSQIFLGPKGNKLSLQLVSS